MPRIVTSHTEVATGPGGSPNGRAADDVSIGTGSFEVAAIRAEQCCAERNAMPGASSFGRSRDKQMILGP